MSFLTVPQQVSSPSESVELSALLLHTRISGCAETSNQKSSDIDYSHRNQAVPNELCGACFESERVNTLRIAAEENNKDGRKAVTTDGLAVLYSHESQERI